MAIEDLVKAIFSKWTGINPDALKSETPIKSLVMSIHDMFWLIDDLKKELDITVPEGKSMMSLTIGDIIELAKVVC